MNWDNDPEHPPTLENFVLAVDKFGILWHVNIAGNAGAAATDA